MRISSCIDAIKISEPQYDSFIVTWSFGGNSSLISLHGNNNPVTSSEHWITDSSDTFSFDADNELSYIGFSVPNKNHIITIKNHKTSFGKIVLSSERIYTIEPMTMRMFDPVNRKLLCFNQKIFNNDALTFLKLHENVDVIISAKGYCGYVINNPLNYFSNETNGYIDFAKKPDDNEYILMSVFFEIMSDNNLEKNNNNIEGVVIELKNRIFPSLSLIRSEFRREIIKSSIQELLDFYC